MTEDTQHDLLAFVRAYVAAHRLQATYEFSFSEKPMYICKQCRVDYEIEHLIDHTEPEHREDCLMPRALELLAREGIHIA